MEYPQAKVAFTQQELTHIRKIDIEKDVKLLSSKLKFRKACLRNFKIAGIVLKRCAEEGLTLFDIGQIIYKEDPDELSIIQQIIVRVENYCQKVNKDSRWRNILQLNNRMNSQKKGTQNQQQFFFIDKLMKSPQRIEEENESCSESIPDLNEENELRLMKINSSNNKQMQLEEDKIQEEENDDNYFIPPPLILSRKERMQSEDLNDYLLSETIKLQYSPQKSRFHQTHTTNNNNNNNETEKDQFLNEEAPRKFSMKRALSDQDLPKFQEDEGIDKQDVLNQLKQPNQSKKSKKKITIKKQEEFSEEEERIQEDLFFRCFEDFLEQELSLIHI
eukprot:TRINITY_DN2943_c0_g2_i1.p1 TRINITY_DN2943_c0_g2~~TRINITY_DN2943_c0_g2_i1.p1  ORF type:complete len:332 (+),score=64.11 TRINITY_DN2943_c0_g2_i1:1284-2279(+)